MATFHLCLPGVFLVKRKTKVPFFLFITFSITFLQVPVHMIGAAFTAAALSVPSYSEGIGNGNDVGGLVAAVLEPVGGFGKFLLVLMALTVPSAILPEGTCVPHDQCREHTTRERGGSTNCMYTTEHWCLMYSQDPFLALCHTFLKDICRRLWHSISYHTTYEHWC